MEPARAVPGAHYVVTPNPEIVEVCREDAEARAAVNGADLVLPDGIGVIKGAAMLGTPLKEKTPGVEFAGHLMDRLAEEGKSLYLLGAKPGVAEQAAAKLEAAVSGPADRRHPRRLFPGGRPGGGGHPPKRRGCGVRLPGRPQAGEVDGEERRRPPAPGCCAAWGAAWTCSPAWWSGPQNSGPTTGWSGSTACARSPAASAG